MPSDYSIQRSPTGLLVIRVSLEHGSAQPLRAYIRRTADVSLGFEAASTEADIESVLASVRIWLEALIDADSAAVAPGNTSNDHCWATIEADASEGSAAILFGNAATIALNGTVEARVTQPPPAAPSGR